MSIGAKASLLKTDDVFRLFVLPADRKLASRAIRHHLHVSRTRFATREELHELTGLVPGCVPPFGEPILPFELYADEAVGAAVDRVAFNAGSLTHSIIMSATIGRNLQNQNDSVSAARIRKGSDSFSRAAIL